MVGSLLTYNDRIISLRWDVRAHKASLTPLLSIEVPVPSQEGHQSCICLLSVSILPRCFNVATLLNVSNNN